ncbi:transposase family protein [Mycobacterium xenopi 3993]|nr:transposase family protein [Mycobacterium xenopi 3993]
MLTRARTALTSTDEPPDSKPTPPSPDRLDCHPKGHAIERTLTPRHWAWPAIVGRVVADGRDTNDLLAGLCRIGIDEIAYRKGHRYVTCVIDHTTGRLVWAAEGRNKDTLGRFFDQLGAERAAALTHVSCDGAEWIHAVLAERAPQAVICLDPFHVVVWAMKALDKVRVRTTAATGTGTATRCGRCARIPPISPVSSAPAWPPSRPPTRHCIGRTCSKSNSGNCFGSKAPTDASCWPGGCHGPSIPASRSSSRSRPPSTGTATCC